jgi:DNA repair photolyase
MKINCAYTELVDIESIKLNPKNPNKHPKEQIELLAKFIEQNGWRHPIIISKRSGYVVCGEGRYWAAKHNGYTQVPVDYQDFEDEEQEMAVLIQDNKIQEFSEWDIEKLANEFSVEDLKEFGFESKEIRNIMDAKDWVHITVDGEEMVVKEEADEGTKLLGREQACYCALNQRIDLGKGECPHKCLYCYVRSITGMHLLKGQIKLVKLGKLKNYMRERKERDCVVIGNCLDACLPIFRDLVEFLLDYSQKHNIYLIFQTKVPKVLLEILQEKNIRNKDLVIPKVSFSICTEEMADILEPNAEKFRSRVETLLRFKEAGYRVIVRVAPLFLGYYDGIEDLIKEVEPNAFVVEPYRVNRLNEYLYGDLNKIINIRDYFQKWGNGKFFSDCNWYDYDVVKLYDEYSKIKGICGKYNIPFGICSGNFGYQCGLLNDGKYCCQIDPSINYDKDALCVRIKENRINEVIVPALYRYEVNSKDWELELTRILFVNDNSIPLLTEEVLAKERERRKDG